MNASEGQKMHILGIESSCDDTGASVLRNGKILSNIVSSQHIHKIYGGVVPELASRAHQSQIVPVVKAALHEAGVSINQIDAIAYTQGPGLLGSLLVGSSFATGLSRSKGIPSIPVNHMQAHIHSLFIQDKAEVSPVPSFPFICLTVSGGHTQLVLVKDYFEMEILGETLDDAAGEAFDKIGKMLGLDYPSGPAVDRLASLGNPTAFSFPVSSVPGYNFSFSGLKTFVMNFLEKEKRKNPDFVNQYLNDLCASVQFTIIKTLCDKLSLAVSDLNILQIGITGGVSANSGLRNAIKILSADLGITSFHVPLSYCTDNAAMIATSGWFAFQQNLIFEGSKSASARMDFRSKI